MRSTRWVTRARSCRPGPSNNYFGGVDGVGVGVSPSADPGGFGLLFFGFSSRGTGEEAGLTFGGAAGTGMGAIGGVVRGRVCFGGGVMAGAGTFA
jgi:hypothetical protein